MKSLNMIKLGKEKNLITVSSKDALKNITRINWSKEVLEGKRKIEVGSIEDYMYNETEMCEWDAISDIFSKAVHMQNMSKSDVEKMITETKDDEWREEKEWDTLYREVLDRSID